MALIAVALLALGVSAPALAMPMALGWLWVLPVVAGYLVLRVRTVVSPRGLDVRNVVSSQSIDWADVRGIRFPRRGSDRGDFSRRWGRAVLADDREVVLPMVTVDRLSLLSLASGGRVPDPVATTPVDETDATGTDAPAPPNSSATHSSSTS